MTNLGADGVGAYIGAFVTECVSGGNPFATCMKTIEFDIRGVPLLNP